MSTLSTATLLEVNVERKVEFFGDIIMYSSSIWTERDAMYSGCNEAYKGERGIKMSRNCSSFAFSISVGK